MTKFSSLGNCSALCLRKTDTLILIRCSLLSRVAPEGAHYLAKDFDSALELVETELADQADQIWVLGGSSVYKVPHSTPLETWSWWSEREERNPQHEVVSTQLSSSVYDPSLTLLLALRR